MNSWAVETNKNAKTNWEFLRCPWISSWSFLSWSIITARFNLWTAHAQRYVVLFLKILLSSEQKRAKYPSKGLFNFHLLSYAPNFSRNSATARSLTGYTCGKAPYCGYLFTYLSKNPWPAEVYICWASVISANALALVILAPKAYSAGEIHPQTFQQRAEASISVRKTTEQR